jgi:hypothetical protein
MRLHGDITRCPKACLNINNKNTEPGRVTVLGCMFLQDLNTMYVHITRLTLNGSYEWTLKISQPRPTLAGHVASMDMGRGKALGGLIEGSGGRSEKYTQTMPGAPPTALPLSAKP